MFREMPAGKRADLAAGLSPLPGLTTGGAAFKSKRGGRKNFAAPGMVLYSQQLRVGCVGVFGDAPPAQPVHQVLWHIHPWETLFRFAVGAQLVERVEGKNLNSGKFVKSLREKFGSEHAFSAASVRSSR